MSSSPTALPLVAPPSTSAAPKAVATDRAATLLGWATLALVLVLGVPIFLCMPVCFDTFHYDICARNLLRGGVHYRDAFDNNLPGIVWLQASVRWLVGWRSESLHAVDLAFFTVGAALLLSWVRPGVRVWAAVALYAFYLFIPEPVPCQRDMWMFLPAVVGLTLRRRQVGRLLLPAPPSAAVFGTALLEGLCWGAAVWIKPFVFVPGLACWVTGLLLVRRAGAFRLRPTAADAAGMLAGGALAGALGLFWLWQSGSWSSCWEILLGWNRDYAEIAHRLEIRYLSFISFVILYVPWSFVPVAAGWLGVAAIRRELTGAPPAAADPAEPARPGHALLAVFFLSWLFQASCLQFPHDYTLAPAILPGIVLVASLWRWREASLAGTFFRLCCLGAMAFLWCVAFQLDRVAVWPRCCLEGSTPQVRSRLVMRKESAYAVDAAALADVETFLVRQGARDGEVTCLSGCTHPLYLDLNLTPSTRYSQVEMTCLFFMHHRENVLAELNASRQRFVVSDLLWTGLTAEEAEETNPDDPLALPSAFPDKFSLMYPWREPIVFRSGRYLVHRVTGPADKFWREDKEIEWGPPKNPYNQFFAGNQSFANEELARASVAVIDALYRRSAAEGDWNGRNQALRKALMMGNRASAAGKEREADVFRRWLKERLDEPAGVFDKGE